MAEVYRADDLQLAQSVALKVLPAAVGQDPLRRQTLVNEVRLARQVSHPNVCRVYDIGEADGRTFVSMEYIDGEDLQSLLRRINRLPEDKGLEISKQVCAALSALHDRHVIHRDLKPANVMLDGRGRVRLTDFGVAAALADTHRDLAGTPRYMAPEQIAGAPASVRTDIYALGLLVHELLTGELPAEQTESTATRPAPVSSRLDPRIRHLIERCLDRDPARRPHSAQAVAAALPGRDELAAQMAAGLTPSPQMIADAGDEGTLPGTLAIPTVMALFAAVAVAALLNGRALYFAAVPFPHSPAVLATKAQEIAQKIGYSRDPADVAYGFDRNAGDYSEWLRNRPVPHQGWADLSGLKPPIVIFWYRSSPEPLVPRAFMSDSNTVGFEVSPADPPLTTPGMVLMRLSPAGELVEFQSVLAERIDPASRPGAVDWSALFAASGLTMESFTRAEPEWLPRVAADVRSAWVRRAPGDDGEELRVEAAAYAGRPVFFRVIAPWSRPGMPATRHASSALHALGTEGLTVISVLTAVGFAVRNLRSGKADVRSATKVAIGAGLLVAVGSAIATRYRISDRTLDTPSFVVMWAASIAVSAWTIYVGIEPYVRRRWPEILIAWNRLLEGRFRDRLVGRALLMGSATGALLLVLRALEQLVSTELPRARTFAWSDPAAALGWAIASLALMTISSLMLLALLVLLRIILRSARGATIGLIAVLLLLALPLVFVAHVSFTIQAVLILMTMISIASMVFVTTRLGLLAAIMVLYVSNAASALSLAFPHPPFLRANVLLALFATLAPGLFGFYTSYLRGKSAGNWID